MKDLTNEEKKKLTILLEMVEESDKFNPLWFGEEDSETARNIREKIQE